MLFSLSDSSADSCVMLFTAIGHWSKKKKCWRTHTGEYTHTSHNEWASPPISSVWGNYLVQYLNLCILYALSKHIMIQWCKEMLSSQSYTVQCRRSSEIVSFSLWVSCTQAICCPRNRTAESAAGPGQLLLTELKAFKSPPQKYGVYSGLSWAQQKSSGPGPVAGVMEMLHVSGLTNHC